MNYVDFDVTKMKATPDATSYSFCLFCMFFLFKYFSSIPCMFYFSYANIHSFNAFVNIEPFYKRMFYAFFFSFSAFLKSAFLNDCGTSFSFIFNKVTV